MSRDRILEESDATKPISENRLEWIEYWADGWRRTPDKHLAFETAIDMVLELANAIRLERGLV